MTSEESTAAIERVREQQQQYREKQQEALRDEDDIGAAYFSGHVSGLILAEEAIKDA